MFRFIKYFVWEWRNYPFYKNWYEHFKTKHPEELKKMEQADLEKGIKPYKNRLDFAFRGAKMRWSHCDRFGMECRKFGGNCDICNENKKGR